MMSTQKYYFVIEFIIKNSYLCEPVIANDHRLHINQWASYNRMSLAIVHQSSL